VFLLLFADLSRGGYSMPEEHCSRGLLAGHAPDDNPLACARLQPLGAMQLHVVG
jgi:hypothetical protein